MALLHSDYARLYGVGQADAASVSFFDRGIR